MREPLRDPDFNEGLAWNAQPLRGAVNALFLSNHGGTALPVATFFSERRYYPSMTDLREQSAVPMYCMVMEGFASVFENARNWREESPDLLRAVHCFLRGGMARNCWVE